MSDFDKALDTIIEGCDKTKPTEPIYHQMQELKAVAEAVKSALYTLRHME